MNDGRRTDWVITRGEEEWGKVEEGNESDGRRTDWVISIQCSIDDVL